MNTTIINGELNMNREVAAVVYKDMAHTITLAEGVINLHAENYLTNEALRTIIAETIGQVFGKKTKRDVLIQALKEIRAVAEEVLRQTEEPVEEVIETPAGDFANDRYYPELQQKSTIEERIKNGVRKAMFDATYNNLPVKYIKLKALKSIVKYNLPEEKRTEENVNKVIMGMFKNRLLSPIKNKDFCCVLV
mgnify:CR=1 FL=1